MRKRLARRGLLSAERPADRTISQHLSVDEFGELRGRKRDARAKATKKGHVLMSWHKRPNDPAGRWNAFCDRCNRVVVVATEPPVGLDVIYGTAITETCDKEMPS